MQDNCALSQPGDVLDYDARGTLIRLQRTIDGAYTRNVFTGPTRVDALARTYTDERQARTEARQLAAALNDGMSVWAFAADAQAAANTVVAVAERIVDDALAAHDMDELAARINADLDAQQAALTAERAAQDADVAAIMAQSTGFRGQPRPTMAGAHLADVSDPQRRALNTHRDGVIFTGPGVGAATLKSLARKGYGRLTFEGRRYRIVALVLNDRGLAEAGVAA
jgi:hypothetical protein